MKKENYKIALDIDDCLAAFYKGFCKTLGHPVNPIDIWDGEGEARHVAEGFYTVADNVEFWENLEVLSNPLDIDFEVEAYITASPESVRCIRKKWLDVNRFPNAPVISSSNKVSVMKEMGIEVLVDDKIETLEQVKRAGMFPIQFVPYYMNVVRLDLNPIYGLNEVKKTINEYIRD